MPQNSRGQTVVIALSLLAGFAAMAGLLSAAAVLLLGLGLGGLAAALGFGLLALGAGIWAAVLALAGPARTADGAATAAGS